MTTLSFILPDNLAKASQEAVSDPSLSTDNFIKQAIVHELAHFCLPSK